MNKPLIFEEIAMFDHHAILTQNTISNLFREEHATKISRTLREWLHLEDQPESISISFSGLSNAVKKTNLIAAFSVPESESLGGISIATFFANHMVNLATKSDVNGPSDFDRGFLGILFADIADDLFASFFPGTRLFLDSEKLKEAELAQENYVFVFKLCIKQRTDHIFLHLPADWMIRSPDGRPQSNRDLNLRFPVIAGTVPANTEMITECAPGDVLIPDHAIQTQEISRTYSRAQVRISDRAVVDIELTFKDDQWCCTFLEKDFSTRSTTLLVDESEPRINILAGNIEIAIEELSKIRAGHAITLDRAVHEDVDLEYDGKVFAKGELVDISGQLGVRIVNRV